MRILYYLFIAIFLRVDLRFFTAKKYKDNKYPVYQKGAITDTTSILAYYKQNPDKRSNLSWIDKQNLDRLSFGKLIRSKRAKDFLNKDLFVFYFLDDTHIGHKLQKPNIFGFSHYKSILSIAKRLTRTPYQNLIVLDKNEPKYEIKRGI